MGFVAGPRLGVSPGGGWVFFGWSELARGFGVWWGGGPGVSAVVVVFVWWEWLIVSAELIETSPSDNIYQRHY
jgi:hypothetical protein